MRAELPRIAGEIANAGKWRSAPVTLISDTIPQLNSQSAKENLKDYQKGQISSLWQAKKSYLPFNWLDCIFMTRLWDQDILEEEKKIVIIVIITYLQSISTIHWSCSVCSTTSRSSFESSDGMKHYDSRKIPTRCCRIHSENCMNFAPQDDAQWIRFHS